MERPSQHWRGFGDLNPHSDKYKQIQLLLGSTDFKYLNMRAMESRKKNQPDLTLNVSCSINLMQFTHGLNNLVLEVAFSDNVFWVARIPHRPLEDGDRTSMLSEIATMRMLQKHTTIPVPRVFDFETSTDQPFGYPFILMECAKGRTLPDGLATTIPYQHHAKVAKQLAETFAQLQALTFSRIGRLWCGEDADQPVEIIAMAWHSSPGPLETSLEYFYNQRQSENREMVAIHPDDPDWITACWVLKTALSHIIMEDRVRGPFPLCHLDLHFGNMLFDQEYNLTAIIDWSNAQAAPLEQLSVCPEFVIFPGLSEEQNRPIVELKNLVLESLREKEKSRERKPPVDNPKWDPSSYPNLTPLSAYMASQSAEITHREYMASPRGSLWAGKRIAKLIYGQSVTWEQLREVYGTMPLL